MKTLVLLVLCLLSVNASLHAQISSYGREFYGIVLPESSDCTRQYPYLLIASPYDALVTISVFQDGYEAGLTTVFVTAMHERQVPLYLLLRSDSEEVRSYASFHVQCNQPICR